VHFPSAVDNWRAQLLFPSLDEVAAARNGASKECDWHVSRMKKWEKMLRKFRQLAIEVSEKKLAKLAFHLTAGTHSTNRAHLLR
jgi:hypothetical protein